MPQFVLIDPSIAALGGHHYEYAVRVLRAAEQAGFTPVLAANRAFLGTGPLPWRVLPAFRYGFFGPPPPRTAGDLLRTLTQRDRSTPPCPSRRASTRASQLHGLLLRSATSAWHRTAFWRQRRAFARDSIRLFQGIRLAEGDRVFLPTLSSAEMLGLLPLFGVNHETANAAWHLLFRRDVAGGREGSQQRLRTAFHEFHEGLCGQSVLFYTDTDSLTADYNRLGVVEFQTLPIPASSVYHGGPALVMPVHRECFHVVYLGDARLEKGYHWLPRLVEGALAAGLPVRFTFQSNYSLATAEPAVTAARQRLAALPPHYGVTLVNSPLSSEAYRALLLSADAVVLPYDREAYRARSSGIFAEALAAGIPTLVPAGTWMASQLAPVRQLAELAFADPADLTKHLADVFAHYDRYRRSTQEFSRGWSALHCAEGIVQRLMALPVPPQTPTIRRP
ncbi:MAG TPA: glycosyltransferase [Pirellulales bacterium]|nr:glycosyltransferase [Pirellulales bacterium]